MRALVATHHVAAALRAEAHVVTARSLLAGYLLVALVKLLHNTGNLLNGLLALLRGHLLPGLHERVVGPLGMLLVPLRALRSLLAHLRALGSLLAGPLRTLRSLLAHLRALRCLLALPLRTLRALLVPLRALRSLLALPLRALPGLAHVVAVAVLLGHLRGLRGGGRLRSLGSTLGLLGKHGKSGQYSDK